MRGQVVIENDAILRKAAGKPAGGLAAEKPGWEQKPAGSTDQAGGCSLPLRRPEHLWRTCRHGREEDHPP